MMNQQLKDMYDDLSDFEDLLREAEAQTSNDLLAQRPLFIRAFQQGRFLPNSQLGNVAPSVPRQHGIIAVLQ
jgi:hypothetical protein